LSTRLKRITGVLLATVALLWASPAYAAAQNNDQQSKEPETHVVEPGDSLWSIAQQRLGAGAPPEQIAEEIDRIYALNQEHIGDTPNLLSPGQELWLVSSATETPAAPQPVAPEQAATEPAAEPSGAEPSGSEPSVVEPTMVDPQPTPVSTASTSSAVVPDEEPSAVEPAADVTPAGALRELDNDTARRMLGFGILALTLILAIVIIIWRLSMKRDIQVPGVWGAYPTFDGHNESPNGANGRGEPRGPAVPASAEPARHLGDIQSRPFTRKHYVDRTGTPLMARAWQRKASQRRATAKTRFSPKKRRPTGTHNLKVRLLLKGVSSNGARVAGLGNRS
jgi:hypothetical protein